MTRLHLQVVVVVAVALGPVEAAAETCAPAARVSGDQALVDEVVPLLRERGVAVDAGSECGELVAVVAAQGARVRVAITDADGRRVERVTSDAAGAATAIESWARPDVTDPLLAARPRVHTALAIDPEPPPAPPTAETPAPAAAASTRRIELHAGLEAGVTGDGALWRSVRAQGCVQVGALCVGAMIRHVADLERSGDAAALGSARSAVDFLLIAEWPWTTGRLTATPGAGLGLSSLRADRVYFGADLEDEHDEAGSLHLRASVAAAYRLAGAWSARLDLALGASPFAPTRLGELDGLPQDEPPLAGVPRLQGWLGLGVSYGGL